MTSAPLCADCGEPTPDEEAAVVRDEWRVCRPCHSEWKRERKKIGWKELRPKLKEGLVLTCGGCDTRLGHWTRRPAVAVLSPEGEVEWVRCGACTAAYREQQALSMVIARLEGGEPAPSILASGVEERLVVSAVAIVRGQPVA